MWLHTAATAAAILADIGEFEGKEKAADLIAATLQDKLTARPLTELHRGSEIGWGLIRALGSLGGKRHVLLLTAYLTGNADAATVAVEALLKIGDEALLPTFLTLLDEAQYSPLRLAAIQGIGQFGQPRHGKKLYLLLKHRDEACRGASARALGQLGDPNAVAPLEQAVRKESFPWVRQTMDDSLDRLNQIHGGSDIDSPLPVDDSKKGA
jgi:HEAT repeat protein